MWHLYPDASFRKLVVGQLPLILSNLIEVK